MIFELMEDFVREAILFLVKLTEDPIDRHQKEWRKEFNKVVKMIEEKESESE